MSWSDEYFELVEKDKKKKKKGKEIAPVKETFKTSPYSAMARLEANRELAKTLTAKTEDVAPTRTHGGSGGKIGEEEEERTWFKASRLWDDGYQFGDVTKTILGTGADLGENIGAGLAGIGERVVDALATVAPYVSQSQWNMNGGDIVSAIDPATAQIVRETNNQMKEDVAGFVAKDLYDEEKVAKFIIDNSLTGRANRQLGVDSEKDSVFGEKTDALAQSGGQLLGQLGANAIAPGSGMVLMGATAFGSEAESALNNGATLDEAVFSGAISAGAEMLSERLGGISFGGKTWTDAMFSKLSRHMTSKLAKVLITSGKVTTDALVEGGEEVFSGYMSAIGQQMSYMSDKEIEELFSKEDALESFIGGVVLGGMGEGVDVAKDIANGVDPISGLTKNEKAVVDKVYKDEVAKAEENGKISAREKTKIYNEVIERMDNGGISTDTIEEVLGDRTAYDSLTKEAEEYDTLYNTATGQLSKAQQDRLAELEAKNKANPYKDSVQTAKDQYSQSVFELVKGDRLIESYNERARRVQKYEADLTQYDAEQQKTIQKAIDSGILNNTNRTHEFVGIIAKISADKGVPFDFVNNEKLKESGFAVDGKTVNGYYSNGTIGVNIDSPKAWQSTVGHEITHVLEGTDMYNTLQETLFEYAKSKGEYDTRLSELTELYKDIKDADVAKELTSDLVGDYLFTDKDFVKNLSTKNRNIFEKIYDEIKYLCKVATAGSKEARELEKVKKAFEDAYRAEGKAQGDTKYSISETTDGRFAAVVDNDILSNIDTSSWDNTKKAEAKKAAADALKQFSGGIVVDGITRKVNKISRREYTRSNYTESLYKKDPDVFADKMRAADVADDIVIVATDWKSDGGLKHFRSDNFVDFDHGKTLIVSGNAKYTAEVVVGITDTGEAVLYDVVDMTPTAFDIKKEESPTTATTQNAIGDIQGDSSADNVAQKSSDVKGQFSLSDSDGNQLSEEQREFFKDSKVVDAEGNLRVVYHGTYEDFTIFDIDKTSSANAFGKGHYFTSHKSDAQNNYASGNGADVRTKIESLAWLYFEEMGYTEADYEGNDHVEEWNEAYDKAEAFYKSGKVMSVYLNMTNPLYASGSYLYNSAGEEVTARSAEILKELGYDGIIDYGVADKFGGFQDLDAETAHYIVFDSNQIKNVDNKAPTSNPDIRFSLSEPVEQTKDLVALHNLKSNELLKSLELGGLPMPSIAIIKAEAGHDQYGEVSLILPKEVIDPQANRDNKVYGGDAWTPTYPRMEYKASETVAKRVRDKYYAMSDEYGSDKVRPLYDYVYEAENALNRSGGESALKENLYDDTEMMQVYLLDSGKGEVTPVQKEIKTELTDHEVSMYEFFAQRLGNEVISDSGRTGLGMPAEQKKAYWQKHGDAIKEAYGEFLSKEFGFSEESIQNVLSNMKAADFLKIVRDAKRYQTNGRVTIKTETDHEATQEAIRKAAGEGYKAWVDDLFKGIEEKSGIRNNRDYYTPSGNPRSWDALHWENTLENVVKAMKQQDRTGSEAVFGVHKFFAASSKDYGSIAEIKADTDRLHKISDGDYKAAKDAYERRLSDIAIRIMDKTNRNQFIAMDNAMECIVDAVRNSKTKAAIYKELRQYGQLNVTESDVDDIVSLVNDISNMPTGYFEAKPMRAVGFDEVAVFVIPRNADVKLKQELLNRGYNIAEYDPDVEGDRQKVVNQFEEYKFSLSNVGEQHKQYGSYNVYMKDILLNKDDISPVAKSAAGETISTEEVAPVVETVNPSVENVEADRGENVLPDDLSPIEDSPERLASLDDADVPPESEAYYAPVKETTTEAIRPKREPSNEPRMVRADSKGKQRKWVGTSTESDAVDGKILPGDLDQDLIHYQPISNKKTLGNANTKLNSMGYETAVSYMNSQFANNKVTLDDIALGERLIQEAVKRGDTKTAGDLIMDISILGTELGQKVQALSIIKRLTPEGQLRMLQRTVERGKSKGDKAFEGVEITQEMIDYILKTYGKDGTYDQAELNKRVEDVKQKIADQMKVTAMDYINEWRYLAMLGNPKTHIRNIVSNVAMWGTRQVKNAIARTIEDIAPVKNRTKTWKFASEDVKNFAKQTTMEMYEGETDNKYSEGGSIKAKRQILPGVIGKASNVNSKSLSGEDTFFSKPAYQSALSEYLTANGITTQEDIKKNPKIVAEAKAYAMDQAKAATFQQDSYIASKISEIERKNPLLNIAIGSVLPFKKTPINIAKTAVSYSPLGFARSVYDAVQVSKGNMEASEAIDHFAQAFTGTSLTLIGYALASAGILNGAGEDDKEGEYDYQLGEQSYSFNFNGDTISLSWLSPVAMPLFVGANAYEQLVEAKDWDWNVVSEALAQTLDPLSEMSFLSSLADVLSSYDSGMAAFGGMIESAGQSYITSFVPTLSSQIAQVTDDTKRSTKISANSGFDFGEETWNKIKYKIPGLRQTLEPTTDIWGNEVKQSENFLTRAFESFLAPYARREDIATEVDEEIKDLYRQTGDTGLIPSIPKNYVSYDGVKYDMSAEEFTDFKKDYGQSAFDLMEQLFATETYRNADSETRADMVNRVYDYASDLARKNYFAKQGIDFTNATKDGKEIYKEDPIKGAIKADMPVDEYVFSEENPSKYSFFKKNGISYDDYASADEDGKRAYTWAYENPGKFVMSKAVAGDVVTYRKYTGELYDIKADKDSSGKSISGSRKEKVIKYINNMDLDYGQKIILFKSEYEADDTYNKDIVEYLNSRSDISYEEMKTILEELGAKVDSKGYISWD